MYLPLARLHPDHHVAVTQPRGLLPLDPLDRERTCCGSEALARVCFQHLAFCLLSLGGIDLEAVDSFRHPVGSCVPSRAEKNKLINVAEMVGQSSIEKGHRKGGEAAQPVVLTTVL
jgi:hypothetical protein